MNTNLEQPGSIEQELVSDVMVVPAQEWKRIQEDMLKAMPDIDFDPPFPWWRFLKFEPVSLHPDFLSCFFPVSDSDSCIASERLDTIVSSLM